jgi:hypothetical protein
MVTLARRRARNVPRSEDIGLKRQEDLTLPALSSHAEAFVTSFGRSVCTQDRDCLISR